MRAIGHYMKLWNLSNLLEVEKNIHFCVSEAHGLCALKFGASVTAYACLNEYSGTRFCEVYEADIENGAQLLERIVPGTELKAIPTLDERLTVFCDTWRNLHILSANKKTYQTYMDWVNEITQSMRERNDHSTLCEKMVKAEQICLELCKTYTSEMLLHGDLHHHNILLNEYGCWRIIDPKGVVGDPVFDIPRFILNEFGDAPDHAKLVYIIRTLSKELGVPEIDLKRLLYVETCMGQCWCLNNGETPSLNEVLFAEQLMDKVK